MEYYAYVLIDPRNSLPFYAGKGKWVNKRHLSHFKEAKTDKMHPKLQKIQKLQRLGLEATWQLSSVMSETDALELEDLLVIEYGSNYLDEYPDGPLCNISPPGLIGGGCSWIWTDQKRKEFSDACMGQNKGEKNGMYGKEGPNLGKIWTDEELASVSRDVYQFDIDGSFIQKWERSKLAMDMVNACGPTFSKACHSNGAWVVGGFRWSFSNAKLNNIIEDKTGSHANSLSNLSLAHVDHVCPHCGKEGRGGSMKRWHFNNCKQKQKDK